MRYTGRTVPLARTARAALADGLAPTVSEAPVNRADVQCWVGQP
jgi:hypothetical protein